jgi:tRNA pseudouridine32 synthase/23S rRNA pseudouridine746 synthase
MATPEPRWQPPPRNGVGASRVGVGDARQQTVLSFLQQRMPAVADWPQRLARGDVLDSRGQPLAANTPCHAGMVIWYWRAVAAEARVPFDIDLLHQDAHLVVVDKPHFLPVTPSGRHLHETVLVRLKQQLGITTLAPMHRLDRETAGVLVFTVQPATRHAYQALLRDRQTHKVYEAIAPWRPGLALPCTARHRLQEAPGRAFMQMQVLAGEPNAETFIECLGRLPGPAGAPPMVPQLAPQLALYRLTPHTGRKHQLRAQMNALGLPIVGDRIYPLLWPEAAIDALPDYSQPLQLLARQISFTDPVSGQPRCFASRRRLWLAPGA